MRDNVLMFGQHKLNPSSMVTTLVYRQITCCPSDITVSLSFILMWPFTAQIHLEVSGLMTHSQMRAWMHCSVNTLFPSVEASMLCINHQLKSTIFMQLNVTIIFSEDPQPRQLLVLQLQLSNSLHRFQGLKHEISTEWNILRRCSWEQGRVFVCKYGDAYTCAFILRLFLGFKYFTVLHQYFSEHFLQWLLPCDFVFKSHLIFGCSPA